MIDFDEMRQQLSFLPDEDLVLILKKHNEEEWRPEVFDIVKSILRERGVSPDLSRDKDVAEAIPLDLVTIVQYANYLDAETDRLALASRGVESWIIDAVENLPIHLQVRQGSEGEALAILAPETADLSNLPEEIANPPCPKCGSRDVGESGEESVFSESMESAADYEWFYVCNSCGYRWAQPE
jgi:hypothetical protein